MEESLLFLQAEPLKVQEFIFKGTRRKTSLEWFWPMAFHWVAVVISKRTPRPSGVCYYVGGKMPSGRWEVMWVTAGSWCEEWGPLSGSAPGASSRMKLLNQTKYFIWAPQDFCSKEYIYLISKQATSLSKSSHLYLFSQCKINQGRPERFSKWNRSSE